MYCLWLCMICSMSWLAQSLKEILWSLSIGEVGSSHSMPVHVALRSTICTLVGKLRLDWCMANRGLTVRSSLLQSTNCSKTEPSPLLIDCYCNRHVLERWCCWHKVCCAGNEDLEWHNPCSQSWWLEIYVAPNSLAAQRRADWGDDEAVQNAYYDHR